MQNGGQWSYVYLLLSYPEYKTMVVYFYLGKKSLWSSLLASGCLLFFRKKIPMVGYYGVVAHLFFKNTIFPP